MLCGLNKQLHGQGSNQTAIKVKIIKNISNLMGISFNSNIILSLNASMLSSKTVTRGIKANFFAGFIPNTFLLTLYSQYRVTSEHAYNQ